MPSPSVGSALELSVVVPAYNEVATVEGVVRAHRDVARRLVRGFEILVCDDGSTDGTGEALAGMRMVVPEIVVIRHPGNLGIPRTMRELYDRAIGEWIYFAPADGQVPAQALEIMWPARPGAGLVVGRRLPRRDPRSRVLIARAYSALLRRLFALPVRDVDSVKLYRAAELRRTQVRARSDFFEAEILIKLVRRGVTVREVDIPHRPRIAGTARGVTAASAYAAALDLAIFTIGDLLGRIGRSAVAGLRRSRR